MNQVCIQVWNALECIQVWKSKCMRADLKSKCTLECIQVWKSKCTRAELVSLEQIQMYYFEREWHFHWLPKQRYCFFSWASEGNGNPFQYSCLKYPRDRGDWQTTVYGVTKSSTTEHTHAQRWANSALPPPTLSCSLKTILGKPPWWMSQGRIQAGWRIRKLTSFLFLLLTIWPDISPHGLHSNTSHNSIN